MSNATVVYISGPMAKYADSGYNYEAFHEAAERWRQAGYIVRNPAEHFDGDTTRPRAEYLAAAFRAVTEVDAVVVLDDWEESAGAVMEVMIARILGKPVWLASRWLDQPWPERLADWLYLGPHGDGLAPSVVVDMANGDVWKEGYNLKKSIDPFDLILQKMKVLHDQKRSDYTGDGQDILYNYRMAAQAMGVDLPVAILGRLQEKVTRLAMILPKGEWKVKDEAPTDTWLDIAIIGVLGLIACEQGVSE